MVIKQSFTGDMKFIPKVQLIFAQEKVAFEKTCDQFIEAEWELHPESFRVDEMGYCILASRDKEVR